MLPTRSTARLATLLAIVITLFATGVAAGAAGAALILGQPNSAGANQTSLQASTSLSAFRVANVGTGRGVEVEADAAAPLRLIAPAGVAPMTVNSTKKVTNLNADRLDGLSSTAFARANVPVTGHFNCMGRALQPESSSALYDWDDGARYATAGTGSFECGVHLPNGSTATAVRCWVHDSHATAQADCFLIRAALDGLPYSLMANTPDYGATPVDVLLEDLTIDTPVVDNTLYAYELNVYLAGSSTTLKVYSMSVEYTVSGLPVE